VGGLFPPSTEAPVRPPPVVHTAPRLASTVDGGRRPRKGGREGGGSIRGGPFGRGGDRAWPSFYNPRIGTISMWPGQPRVPPVLRRQPSRRRLPTECHLRLRHRLDALVPAGWRMGPRLPRRRLQHHGDDPPHPSTGWSTPVLPTTPLPLQACSLGPIPPTPRSSLETVPL
jgi:hypothetical protein